MNKKALLVHIIICLVIGGVISSFTSAKWIAAAFWISAALNINGSLAIYEDELPGGFNNPDGKNTSEITEGIGVFKFWLKEIVFSLGLAAIGLLIQIYT
jgi:hypothetical protein